MSASGARVRGDDYQHLFTWYQAVRAILPESGIVKIGVEDPDAGNADDVTVYTNDGRRECYQTKSSVDARKPISTEWLMNATRSGGPSIIQGFYQLWDEGQDMCKPRICLVTNKLPKHGDPLLSHIDGRDGTVMRGLERTKPDSKIDKIRGRLAKHLGVSEGDTVRFFGDVRFTLGRGDGEWRQLVKERMYAAGLRSDDEAVDQGHAFTSPTFSSVRQAE